MRARRDRLAIGLGALGSVLCLAVPGSAMAGSLLVVSAGGSSAFLSPLAPASSATPSPGGAVISGTPILAAPSFGSATSNSDQHGPDARWGDPLSTKLFDSDSVQAGFRYYAGSSEGGSQGGVGFSLTFKN